MKILVLFKTVPIFERVLESDWKVFSLHSDLSYAGNQINCFDESALEIGLRLRDEFKKQEQDAECIAITVGVLHPAFAQTLFAAGFDNVVEIKADDIEFAPETVAEILVEYIAQCKYDIIITGNVAGMADTGTVPLMISDALSCPLISNATEIHLCKEGVDVLCQESDGVWQRRVKLPFVISVGNSSAVLRAVTLRARLAAQSRNAQVVYIDNIVRSNRAEISFSQSTDRRACDFTNDVSLEGLAEKLMREELNGEMRIKRSQFVSFCPENAVIYDVELIKWFTIDGATKALLNDWRQRKPKLALFPDTYVGRKLAYRLAKETGSFFMSGASFADNGVSVYRRACASNVIVLQKLCIPAVFSMQNLPNTAEKIKIITDDSGLPSWLLCDEKRESSVDCGLKNKRLSIICGAGIGSRQNCVHARLLAKRLDAGFGLTRIAALNGWGEPGEIVGQSGASVSSEVCLVLGASGAGAFAIGLENAARVIAVNIDRNAMIFKYANVGIIADAPSLLQALLNQEDGK